MEQCMEQCMEARMEACNEAAAVFKAVFMAMFMAVFTSVVYTALPIRTDIALHHPPRLSTPPTAVEMMVLVCATCSEAYT